MSDVFTKGPIELRLGDYRNILADVEPDAVITDPPYGERTHAGHRAGVEMVADGWSRSDGRTDRRVDRSDIGYAQWSSSDVGDLVDWWASSSTGWLFPMTSHDLVQCYQAAAPESAYAFAPVPCIMPGMTVRLAGDGPSSWAVYGVPVRPRSLGRWGTLPGAYVGSPGLSRGRVIQGSKPLWLMRAIVRDYSRPDGLVCDPCAGGATTLIAAALEGRRAIGAELDPETFAKACARIERTALTPPLFHDERRPKAEQGALDLEVAS